METRRPRALAPTDSEDTVKKVVKKVVTSLVRDEIRHIGYTARLLRCWAEAGEGERIAALFARRLYDYGLITITQTGAAVASCGPGHFAGLRGV